MIPWAILTREECFRIVHNTSQLDLNPYLPVFVGIPFDFLDFL